MKYTQPLNEVEDAHYVNGDPTIGQTGSIIPAGALENPQREIVNAITDAGLTPSASNNSQLAQAISAKITAATSAIQTQINGKQATLTGAATSIASSNLTASRAVISNSSGKVAVSSTTSTELDYVHGVTSAIQNQINGKAGLSSNNNFTGTNTFVTQATSDRSQKPATTDWVKNWKEETTETVHVVVETYINGKSWYRVYDDKWIEQGGEIKCQSAWSSLTFLKPFANTNYHISGSSANNSLAQFTAQGTGAGTFASFMGLSTTGCQVYTGDDESFNNAYCRWFACGKGV